PDFVFEQSAKQAVRWLDRNLMYVKVIRHVVIHKSQIWRQCVLMQLMQGICVIGPSQPEDLWSGLSNALFFAGQPVINKPGSATKSTRAQERERSIVVIGSLRDKMAHSLASKECKDITQ